MATKSAQRILRYLSGKLRDTQADGNSYVFQNGTLVVLPTPTGTADKLTTARTIASTGDATWSVSFDGSKDVSAALTLANVATAGTYPKVTVNAKGLVTSGAALVAADIPSLDASILGSGTLPIARGGTGNANGTAVSWTTARNLALTGDGAATLTGVDGSANVSATFTLATVATAGTYPKVTVNAKGLVTSGTALVAGDIPSLPASIIASGILPAARGGTGNGNGTASAWTTARTLSFTGGYTGSVSIDGSQDVSVNLTASTAYFTRVPLTVNASGQTQFTVSGGYTPGLILVDRNGILQTGFTATDGSTITLASGTTSTSDTVTAYRFGAFNVANALPLAGGTLSGNLVAPGITMTGSLNQAPIVSLASAATVNIGAAAANDLTITGTTAITAFDTVASGVQKRLTFAGALTLTYNATSLILPGKANITTAAGDVATFVPLGGGNWRCVGYQLASSVGGGGGGGSGVITKYFESAQQNIVAGGSLTIAHGLGARPKFVTISLVCQTAEGGYSAGDWVELGGGNAATTESNNKLIVGPVVTPDVSNIYVITGGRNPAIANKSSGAYFPVDPSNWRYVFKAYL